MPLDIEALDKAIRNNLYNPQNIFKDSLELFADATDGLITPVNTTNPFVNMMMYMATQSAISNDQIERASRRMLPEYANSISELAPHFDYTTLQTIYATPSSTVINLVLPITEMLEYAETSFDGTSYMVIPKETIFSYSDGLTFSLHHDIMLRIIDSDTMDMYYLDNDNPLKGIEIPIINYTKKYASDENFSVSELVSIPIKAYQFSTSIQYRSVSRSSGYDEIFTLTDSLYHIRVLTTVNGKTTEFLTVHGDFKYNPNSATPIVVMQYLTDNTIRLKIPDVYIENGLVGSEITIKILETKGNISLDLVNDGTFNFVPTFVNNDVSIEKGVNALRKIINLGAYSATDPAGGVDTPTLAELRDRVILGSTSNVALSEAQLSAALNEIDYDLGHEFNYIGNSVFTATNKLGNYTGGDIPTTIGAANIVLNMNNLVDKAGVIFPTDTRAVVTPKAVIDDTQFNSVLLSNSEYEYFTAMDSPSLVSKLNRDTILSPIFYYLLDTTTDTPAYGAFDLDNPTITVPDYLESNLQNSIKIATSKIHINKVDGSYYIHILTTGNDLARELTDNDITVQISTTDEFGSIYSVNGVLQSRTKDGDYLFRVELITGFNISMDSTIEILNLYNIINSTYHLPLSDKFSISYVVSSPEYVTTDNLLESAVNTVKLPNEFSVVTIETTTITIGRLLSGLFTPIKSSVGATTFETYLDDVPLLWEEDQYEEEDGVRKFYVNPDFDGTEDITPTNAPLLFVVTHEAGTQVIDDNGVAQFTARAGDVVRDSNNNPIPIGVGNFNHLVTLQGLDYKFKLIGYNPQIQAEIKANLDNDIAPMDERMIVDTELRYAMGNTVGNMEVVIDGDTTSTISNEITMSVIIKVSESTYNDTTLRNNIVTLTKKAIVDHLSGTSYVENALVDSINTVIKSSVVSFKITSISTLGAVQSFQLVNTRDDMGVKSILAIGDTGEYEILDGIDVSFVSL